MAAIYEINEVGFLGSIWQGQIAAPIAVGRTVEIISNSSKTLFFAAKEDIDIQRFNEQEPDTDSYYEIGYLDDEEIRNLELFTNVSPIYSKTLTVLVRFKKQDTEKRSVNSRLPLQKFWQFDTNNSAAPKYTYSQDPDSIRYINYVFLVTRSELEVVISYFENAPYRYEMIDIRGFVNPKLQIHKSTSDLIDIMGGFPIDPPSYTGSLYTIPPADLDTYAETAAEIDFRNHAAAYSIHTMDEANQKLKELQTETNFIFSTIDILSGVDRIDVIIRAKVIEKLRAFVLSQMISLHTDIESNNNSGHSISDLDGFMLDDTGSFIKLTSSGSNLISNVNNSINTTDEFDELIDDIIEELTLDDNDVYTYKKISKVSDYSLPILKHKTYGLFKCAGEKLDTFFTGSLSDKNLKYYTSVYNNVYASPNSFHQFDIAYAHISGSGSSYIENGLDFLPSKVMYSKYMLECFGNTRIKFPFKNNKNGDYFYIIQLDRDSMRDKLDAGNFEITLCPLSGSTNQYYNTGSNYNANQSSSVLFTLIDESGDTRQKITDNGGHQEYYYISSGSLRDGLYGESTDDAWGIVFPNMGLIILDGVVLDQSCSFNTVTASFVDGDNSRKLFISISGSATRNTIRTISGSFFARSAETDIVETYFCRAEHDEFNNSTNYTYITGSGSLIKYDYFKKEPNSYITTIGMYNRDKELIAVGKLKTPVLKNSGNTYTFQVRIKLN